MLPCSLLVKFSVCQRIPLLLLLLLLLNNKYGRKPPANFEDKPAIQKHCVQLRTIVLEFEETN
jgi:hypothetical protein